MNNYTILVLTILTIFLISCAALKAWFCFTLGLIFATSLICLKHTYHIDRYSFKDPKVDDLRDRIATVIPEIYKVKLLGSNKSFTIDKQVSYICVKNASGEYYPDNMLIYVILHELAHALCDEINPPTKEHTPKWEAIFKQLLTRASEAGIYDPNIPIIEDYCGYNA